jgi:hypothetical protein
MQETGVSRGHKEDMFHVCRREHVRYLLTVCTKKTKLLSFPYSYYFTAGTFLLEINVKRLIEIN